MQQIAQSLRQGMGRMWAVFEARIQQMLALKNRMILVRVASSKFLFPGNKNAIACSSPVSWNMPILELITMCQNLFRIDFMWLTPCASNSI